MPDQVEQRGRRQAGPLADHGAIAAAPAVAAVLQGLVGRPTDGVLDKAVAVNPAGLFVMRELRPQGRGEPVEQVEEGAGVAAGQRTGERQGGAADVGQNTGGNALGAPAALVLMHLVGDQQVEPARQALLDVVGERIAAGTAAVGLPEGGPALGTGALAAGQLRVCQGHPVGGGYLSSADRARRDAEGVAGVLIAQQPPVGTGPAWDHGRLPAVGQLGALAGEDGEEWAGTAGVPEALQGGDGGDDGGAGSGDGGLYFPLPFPGEVGRDEHQDALAAGEVGGGGGDEGLAGTHLADDGGAALGAEGVGGPANGGLLGAQRAAEQRRQRPVVRGGVVLRWVGMDDALGDGRLVGIEERAQVHVLLLSVWWGTCRDAWGTTVPGKQRRPRRPLWGTGEAAWGVVRPCRQEVLRLGGDVGDGAGGEVEGHDGGVQALAAHFLFAGAGDQHQLLGRAPLHQQALPVRCQAEVVQEAGRHQHGQMPPPQWQQRPRPRGLRRPERVGDGGVGPQPRAPGFGRRGQGIDRGGC